MKKSVTLIIAGVALFSLGMAMDNAILEIVGVMLSVAGIMLVFAESKHFRDAYNKFKRGVVSFIVLDEKVCDKTAESRVIIWNGCKTDLPKRMSENKKTSLKLKCSKFQKPLQLGINKSSGVEASCSYGDDGSFIVEITEFKADGFIDLTATFERSGDLLSEKEKESGFVWAFSDDVLVSGRDLKKVGRWIFNPVLSVLDWICGAALWILWLLIPAAAIGFLRVFNKMGALGEINKPLIILSTHIVGTIFYVYYLARLLPKALDNVIIPKPIKKYVKEWHKETKKSGNRN